jgi:hypothetical protein
MLFLASCPKPKGYKEKKHPLGWTRVILWGQKLKVIIRFRPYNYLQI